MAISIVPTSVTATNETYFNYVPASWQSLTSGGTGGSGNYVLTYTPITPVIPPANPDTPEQWLRNRVKEICDLAKL